MNQSNFNIVSLFQSAAKKYPTRTAIIEKNGNISYELLAKEVRQTAAYFSAKGITEGDRVLVFVPISIDLYRIVLALFHIGATAVFLDEWVSKERLLVCCKLAKCKGFIGTTKARMLSLFAKELRQIPIKLRPTKKYFREHKGIKVSPDRSALITYTTGSTGTPKAADRSHNFLYNQFKVLKAKLDSQATDIDMTMLPITLFLNLGVGATSVIANYNSRKPNGIRPERIVKQLKENKVNRLTSSPYVVKCLSEYLIKNNENIDSIKQIFTGGAPVFPAEGRLYLKAFPKSKTTIIYGSTEAEPISSISATDLVNQSSALERGLPVGSVHHSTDLKIIPLNWKQHRSNLKELSASCLDEDEVGEIIVAGDHVLKKYHNNPRAFVENKIIVEDEIWHRTGDSGFLKDGQLFLTGRSKQLIFRKDKLISPFIVENYVQEIDGVTAGTMLSIDDKLIVIIETKLSKALIIPQLKSLVYDQLHLSNRIPRDPRHHSKIDYDKLKSNYQGLSVKTITIT